MRLFCAAKAALKRAEEAICDLERFEECATTIVMTVAAAESMLNQAALSLVDVPPKTPVFDPGDRLFKRIERRPLLKKARALASRVGWPLPDSGEGWFPALEETIEVRHRLVHEKERAIPHEAGPPGEYPIDQKVTLDAARKAVKAVAELAKWLRDFVPQVDEAMTDLTLRRD